VETLRSQRVYANPRLAVREDTIRRPSGTAGTYWVVDTSDIALVVPFDGKRLHLVEQYRHPVGRRTWEFPSGTADADLDGAAAEVAARELREETGLQAATLTRLGTLDITPSTMTQQCAVFLAEGLTGGTPQREPEEQDMTSAWFTRADVDRMINDGAITDSKSLAAYALFLIRSMASPV